MLIMVAADDQPPIRLYLVSKMAVCLFTAYKYNYYKTSHMNIEWDGKKMGPFPSVRRIPARCCVFSWDCDYDL
jgi:hypothetical protein